MRLTHLGLLALLACGDSGEPSTPTGTVVFVLDGQSCPAGTFTVEMFVDGVSRGSYPIVSGGVGQSFEVPAGGHALAATAGQVSWGPTAITVNDGQTFTYTLPC